jgi:hypothetical protein
MEQNDKDTNRNSFAEQTRRPSYIELANIFWKKHFCEYFSTSEIALFFFLLNEANRNYWRMPFTCPTEYVCARLKISRQGLCNARKSLVERGLLQIVDGIWGSTPPKYFIGHFTNGTTIGLTDNLTDNLTKYKIGKNNNNIDSEEKNTKKRNSNRERKNSRKEMKPISELSELFLSDLDWQKHLLDWLAVENIPTDLDALRTELVHYLQMLLIKGTIEMDVTECKKNAFSYIVKKQKNIKEYGKGNKTRGIQCRRGGFGTADNAFAKTEDYEEAF